MRRATKTRTGITDHGTNERKKKRKPRAKVPGRFFSEATRLIWLHLDEENLSIKELSRRIGLGRGMLDRYLDGSRRPMLDPAFLIADHLDFDVRLFTVPPKESFRIPAGRRRAA